jgi:SAM-dependent methyltransferase
VQPAWSEGYVVDIGYTQGYYRELAPSWLGLVALLGGLEAPDSGEPFNYYELGCGNGLSTLLHAAVHPHARFTGVDFNPTHIHNAQRLARETGAANVRFLEKSFAELAEGDDADIDMVCLHGVWSWIAEEPRRQIVEFIRRRLKPGGLVYLSYNSLPGLAQVAPLQRLLIEHAELGGGDSLERMQRTLAFAARLEKAGAAYFRANPLAKARLDRLGGHDPRYLAHEYLNANWTPFYHADVARDLAAAKLAFAGSAELIDNFNQFALAPAIAELIADLRDRTAVETIKDYARNQVFRRDVYARGAPQAGPREREALLGRTRFALARPRASCKFVHATPAGEVTLEQHAYAPVLEALGRTPMTFDELAGSPEAGRMDRNRLRQAVFGMAALGNVQAALPERGEPERRAAATRFNQALLRQASVGSETTMLASPVLGCGVPLNFIHRLFVGASDEAEGIARAQQALARGGQKLMKGEQPVESPDEVRAALAERARFFFHDLLPFYRQVGALE